MNPQDWQTRYEQDDTPWDQGRPAPALEQYLCHHPVSGRILVPGCGRGHEVKALGSHSGLSVVGLDLSSTAIAQAKELVARHPLKSDVSFVEGDFLTLPANFRHSFDWLVEHTCFCAIDPLRRPDYVQAAAAALRIGGKIFGIFYLNPDVNAGPPYGVTPAELTQLFSPAFTLMEEWIPNEAFPGRENRELVRILQKVYSPTNDEVEQSETIISQPQE